MERQADGRFEVRVPEIKAGTAYYYHVDGTDVPDPVSRSQPQGVHGPSCVVDGGAFAWSDAGWRGREMADLVIYELHVGTFTAAGTFDAVIGELPALRELGVTAIELMPVGEFPGGRNWGYDGVHLYAPQSSYGGPDGLQRLVDAAHRNDLAVLLDVVYNHVGPEGNYLGAFGPYFTEFYQTPWGAALNFDGPDSDDVRRYFIDNALYWVTDFHIDGLRLDAVHAICDFGARHLLEEIADRVHAQGRALGRRACVIAESDLSDPRLVRPRERGGYGLDAQWSDDLHHAVHAALTGEQQGYYADFGGVAPVAKVLRDRFVYDGRRSAYRRRRHGAPATDVPGDRFVVFAQNHDQIGNRARGERLAGLVTFEQQKLAAAVVLLGPYVPLLFMGEEYGERSPFLYFVSHGDPELVEAVRAGRRREFAAFGWAADVPDPQAEETFCRSRIDRTLATTPGHREILALHRDLLLLRRSEPALRAGGGDCTVTDDGDAGWVALSLTTPGTRHLLVVFNFAASPREVSLANPTGTRWRVGLATSDARYGGTGPAPVDTLAAGATLRITMPPTAGLLYRAEES
jgi:maltooligosyltrehalose trehalohydrolase